MLSYAASNSKSSWSWNACFNFGFGCNRPGRQLGVDASARIKDPVVIGNNSWGLLLGWGSITRAIRAFLKVMGAVALLSSYMDRSGQAFDVSRNGISYHEQATSAVRDRIAFVPCLWLISAAVVTLLLNLQAHSFGAFFWPSALLFMLRAFFCSLYILRI